jgi:hypothetical protein
MNARHIVDRISISEADAYTTFAIRRQAHLVQNVALALSRFYGILPKFIASVSGLSTRQRQEIYWKTLYADGIKNFRTVRKAPPDAWEKILEVFRTDISPEHPYVRKFNKLAAQKGILTRIYDTGPKDFCTAKIKAWKSHGGDVSRLDDINRIMIESTDPLTHWRICRSLAEQTGGHVAHQEKRLMQGFVSDVYMLKMPDGISAEIAFVPAGMVLSSKITHNALRFRRATPYIDLSSAKALFHKTCVDMRSAFRGAADEFSFGRHDPLAFLSMEQFDMSGIEARLRHIEDGILKAVLKRRRNKKWQDFPLAASHKYLVYVLGGPGSGKTTLSDFICGAEMAGPDMSEELKAELGKMRGLRFTHITLDSVSSRMRDLSGNASRHPHAEKTSPHIDEYRKLREKFFYAALKRQSNIYMDDHGDLSHQDREFMQDARSAGYKVVLIHAMVSGPGYMKNQQELGRLRGYDPSPHFGWAMNIFQTSELAFSSLSPLAHRSFVVERLGQRGFRAHSAASGTSAWREKGFLAEWNGPA